MTFIEFEPATGLKNVQDKISQIFGDFNDASNNLEPAVDISEDKENIYFEMETPGVQKDDISISLEKNILLVKGEKKFEVGKDNPKKFVHTERHFGSFERKFRLLENVDSDNITAEFENGVLTITVQKIKEKPAEERTIEIK